MTFEPGGPRSRSETFPSPHSVAALSPTATMRSPSETPASSAGVFGNTRCTVTTSFSSAASSIPVPP